MSEFACKLSRALRRGLLPAAVAAAMGASASATIVPGSAGYAVLNANDPDHATGSFSLQVAYQMYDGSSAADPLGANGQLQLAFVLTHGGSAGEAPTLPFGRFSVFGPDPSDPVAYYTSIQAVNPASAGQFIVGPIGHQYDPFGGIAPSATDIDPPPAPPNRGEFFFLTGLNQANFQPEQHSRLLVLTLPGNATLPEEVVIEADRTDTVPSIDADTTIRLVPEPASGVLAAMALLALRRRA